MKRLKPSLKNQGLIFAEHFIDDRLPSDHEVYIFDALIDEFDIKEIINSYGTEGGKLYSPRDQLAVLLYAYSKGITSSYKIADEVVTNLPFIYLAGGHQFGRRSICEFRRRNAKYLKKFFSSIVQKAISVGLVDTNGTFAIDGSKFSAEASKSKTKTKNEWQERREKIESSIDRFLNEIEKNDQAEEGLEEERTRKFKDAMAKIQDLKSKKNSPKSEIREANRIERQINEDQKIDTLLKENPNYQK